jgi:hypothetical protein
MKNTLKKSLALLLMAVGLAATTDRVSAAMMIQGQIGLVGRGTLNGSLATATGFSTFDRVRVGFVADEFVDTAAVPVDTQVTMNPFAFDAAPATPIELWSFQHGASTYSFNLHTVGYERLMMDGYTFLNVSGTGYAYIDGVRQTPAEFGLSAMQGSGSSSVKLTWSAETVTLWSPDPVAPAPPVVNGPAVAGVPEAGSALFLLIAAMVSVEILRKRINNQESEVLLAL